MPLLLKPLALGDLHHRSPFSSNKPRHGEQIPLSRVQKGTMMHCRMWLCCSGTLFAQARRRCPKGKAGAALAAAKAGIRWALALDIAAEKHYDWLTGGTLPEVWGGSETATPGTIRATRGLCTSNTIEKWQRDIYARSWPRPIVTLQLLPRLDCTCGAGAGTGTGTAAHSVCLAPWVRVDHDHCMTAKKTVHRQLRGLLVSWLMSQGRSSSLCLFGSNAL